MYVLTIHSLHMYVHDAALLLPSASAEAVNVSGRTYPCEVAWLGAFAKVGVRASGNRWPVDSDTFPIAKPKVSGYYLLKNSHRSVPSRSVFGLRTHACGVFIFLACVVTWYS